MVGIGEDCIIFLNIKYLKKLESVCKNLFFDESDLIPDASFVFSPFLFFQTLT